MNRAQMFHNFITSLKLGDKVLIRDGGITAAFDELCGDTASFDEKTDDNGTGSDCRSSTVQGSHRGWAQILH